MPATDSYMKDKIKVMIIDDSALVRQVVSEILKNDPKIEVIATAADPIFAEKYLEKQWPDVIILDIEMPRMDGITFLRKIMREHPTPVVICSSLTDNGAEQTIAAMAAGAVGIITKPQIGLKDFLNESAVALIDAVKSAAVAEIKKTIAPATPSLTASPTTAISRPKLSADAIIAPGNSRNLPEKTDRIVAIGASTGGTQAIEQILKALPADSPGIVIVQHMPAGFTKAFADRLNEICTVEVREAVDGDEVRRGRVLIAPGGYHMLLKRRGTAYYVAVTEGPLVNRHRPSVDVLFRSVAQEASKNALGILLTGMGDDGAAGMAEMHASGVRCIAQDEKTCVVFGMPREAIRRGAVDRVLPLQQIAAEIIAFHQS